MNRLLFSATVWQHLQDLFNSAGSTEDGAFFLFRVGRSGSGRRMLAYQALLPGEGAWEERDQDRLVPSGQWMSAALGSAIDQGCGLGFVHSHPDERHPPSLSPIDLSTSATWSRSICQLTGSPFVSLVWSRRGVSGIWFDSVQVGHPSPIDRIEVLGNSMAKWLSPMDESSIPDSDLDDRQIRALTALGNTHLRGLSVGIIGTGGTGSPLAEQLARMGVHRITLVDPDVLDTPSNLRRVVGSRRRDLGAKKVSIVARHLRSLGFPSEILPVAEDIRTEHATRMLLDSDIAILTTDTHSSRAFANQLAYQYWLPIIDVGTCVGTSKEGSISGMPIEVRVLLPDNACLWCRGGVIDAERIREENLPAAERKRLAAEGYVQGLQQPQPSLAALNYVAAGSAAIAMLRLYSGQPTVFATAIFDSWEQYTQVRNGEINPDCVCRLWRGRADDLPIVFQGTG